MGPGLKKMLVLQAAECYTIHRLLSMGAGVPGGSVPVVQYRISQSAAELRRKRPRRCLPKACLRSQGRLAACLC